MIKENIASLLEEIMERSLLINQQNQQDVLLDIDLVMEDLRRLYREYAALRAGHTKQLEAGQQDQPVVADSFSEVVAAAQESEEYGQSYKPEAAETPRPAPHEVPPERPGELPQRPEEEIPAPPPPDIPQELPSEVPPQRPEELPREPKGWQQPAPTVSDQEPDTTPSEQMEPQPHDIPAAPSTPEEKQEVNINSFPEKQADESRNGIFSTKAQEPVAKPVKSIIDLFSEAESQSIGDKFNVEDNSLHQKFSHNKGDFSIGARMQQQPIASIKDAIGVNDKFLFINELFHGNIQTYNEAINTLNNFDGNQSAFSFLNELATTHSWDQKRCGETIEKLANFVQRRYL